MMMMMICIIFMFLDAHLRFPDSDSVDFGPPIDANENLVGGSGDVHRTSSYLTFTTEDGSTL